jgi:hypothetical protein
MEPPYRATDSTTVNAPVVGFEVQIDATEQTGAMAFPRTMHHHVLTSAQEALMDLGSQEPRVDDQLACFSSLPTMERMLGTKHLIVLLTISQYIALTHGDVIV